MVVVDISILRGTEFVHQFPGGVEVTLDIPAGYEEANTKVFRMEADGTATDMQAACKDGKAVFVTNHFSTYVIAEQAKTAEEAPKVVNENVSTTQTEAAKAENTKNETRRYRQCRIICNADGSHVYRCRHSGHRKT